MKEGTIITIVLFVIVFSGFLMGIWASESMFYKQGQIDAINGNVVFELKKMPDNTMEWVRKDGE